MVRTALMALIAALTLASLASGAAPPQRVHIPRRNLQDKAEFLVRKQFPDAFKTSVPDEEARFAAQLRKVAEASADDTVRQYVLLRDARELSVAAGDFEGAFGAIDQMGTIFQINPEDDKVAALSEGVDMSNLQPPQQIVAYLRITDVILDQHDPPLAQKSLLLASEINRHLRDAQLKSRIDVVSQRVLAAVRELNQARTALKQLKNRPADPKANWVVGRYLCGVCEQWEQGLPYLAKGQDRAVAAAAKLDLAAPRDGAGMITLGDAWADMPAPESGLPAKSVQHRSVFWYRKALALPKLDEADRAKVMRRLAATQPSEP